MFLVQILNYWILAVTCTHEREGENHITNSEMCNEHTVYIHIHVCDERMGLLCTHIHILHYRGCIGMCNIDTAEAVVTNVAQTSCNVECGLF